MDAERFKKQLIEKKEKEILEQEKSREEYEESEVVKIKNRYYKLIEEEKKYGEGHEPIETGLIWHKYLCPVCNSEMKKTYATYIYFGQSKHNQYILTCPHCGYEHTWGKHKEWH